MQDKWKESNKANKTAVKTADLSNMEETHNVQNCSFTQSVFSSVGSHIRAKYSNNQRTKPSCIIFIISFTLWNKHKLFVLLQQCCYNQMVQSAALKDDNDQQAADNLSPACSSDILMLYISKNTSGSSVLLLNTFS